MTRLNALPGRPADALEPVIAPEIVHEEEEKNYSARSARTQDCEDEERDKDR